MDCLTVGVSDIGGADMRQVSYVRPDNVSGEQKGSEPKRRRG